MPRPSQLRRCSWALALLACLGSAHAAWMPDGPDADTPRASTNPVLETFLQQQNMSCLTCHTGASTAKAAGFPRFASSYSFLLGHAKPSQ